MTVKKTVRPTPRNTDADLDARVLEAVPTVTEMGYEAHRLRIKGLSWAEVAKAVGATSTLAAASAVSHYLQRAAKEQSAQQLQEALQTQVDRYEEILKHWWGRATSGHDEKAATVVLRTMERLDRVLRLTDDNVVVSRETIVISANPDEYVKQLQGVVVDRRQHAIEGNGSADG